MDEPVGRCFRSGDQRSPCDKPHAQPNQAPDHAAPPNGVRRSLSAYLTTAIVRTCAKFEPLGSAGS